MSLKIKLFIKNKVISETPYIKNGPTAPAFKILTEKNFEVEKARLVEHIRTTQAHRADYFEGKESLSFGALTWYEWNNMMYKHLDHHLKQFGA